MAVVIAMLNQKGGVGKTTLTVNLGGTWARAGRRVLLVDNDPQASLTQGLIGPEATSQLHPDETIASLYGGTAVLADQAVVQTAFNRLHLLRGSEHAAAYNNGAPHTEPWQRQECLAEALAAISGQYDFVLIDCPPNLNLCSWAALTAADFVLVPTQAEDYGSQGLPSVLRSVEAVRRIANPRVRFLGLVISMFSPRRAIHQLYAETLRSQYESDLFATYFKEAPEVAEATMRRMPLPWYKPKSAISKSLTTLASEIESRLIMFSREVA